MATMRRACFLLPLLAAGGPAAAFNGHAVAEGPLKLTIDDVPDVTTLAAPVEVRVTVANTGTAALAVNVRMGGLVDEWRAVGETEKRFDVAAGKSAEATYHIEAGKGTLSALYPVHLWAAFDDGGRRREAHAVRIFQTRLPPPPAPAELPVTVVPARGAVALAGLRACQAAWQYYDQPLVQMPVGWQGSAAPSRATFGVQAMTRGTTKRAIAMHPPWQPGGGTIFAEYRLKLPEGGPIRLSFANAIRDHAADEPASDGVTFRVWVGQEKLFERHTDRKTWLDGRADLSRFAGKTVLLRLESHPGPKRNTTCDSSFWGDPVVAAGEQPAPPTEAEWKARRELARRVVAGEVTDEGLGAFFAFDLAGGYRAAVVTGQGLADAAIAFGKGDKCVVFDGMRMAVLGEPIGRSPSRASLVSIGIGFDGPRRTVTHVYRLDGKLLDLTAELWAEGPGLRVRFRCPQRITDLSLGPADLHAPRVYYGHGYCIVEPEAFRAGFGGHNLSTSHVGFDFAGGVSLLAASDNPPDFLEVAPASRHYALHTHMDATLTFVPGTNGALDCAVRYQPLYDKQPAGGFRRKAGRFVFDIWGGRYAEIAETMKRMISYGLTDSLLTVHVWQRWGYDYRLPEIFPPDPKLGTAADMRNIAAVCKAHDIPWGLHDNYIDFYPDANGYSYDHICFTPDGAPVRAWLNESRDAQSYRWRPDAFMPFLKRNLELIKRDLAPTHYFIDVFTSIGPFDYTDRQGQFHSFLETRKCWGEAFAWIREHLGGDAPTTSEAGHDQLTGTLDGADCQHLRLSPAGQRFCIRLPCKDWQRTPWFDAVLHDKFSLHGVGYSDRYQGGLPRRQAGIESDDYVSAEVLTGHALMIDRGAFGRGAVRKYWLAQGLIRSLATDRIAGVEFAGGDIHRQVVTWQAGAKVHVNRGADDWHVAGRTLPPFGYLAKNGPVESSIERIGGVIVEQSRGPGRCYVNGRGFNPHQELPIRPVAERVEDLGDGRFRLIVGWQAERPAPRDLMAFLHFDDARLPSREKIAFQGDFRPAVGTSKWQGRVVTGQGQDLQVPDGDAREYSIGIGLWDPSAGRRYPLLGEDDGSMRYLLGKLIVDRKDGKPTAVRLLTQPPAREPAPRWNVAGKPIDFGPIVTAGAVRCEVRDGAIVVTPLPDTPAFAVTIRPARLTGRDAAAKIGGIQAVDESGKALRDVPFEAAEGAVTFTTRPGEFAYRLTAAEVHSYGARRQRRRFDFPAPGASPAKAASVPPHSIVPLEGLLGPIRERHGLPALAAAVIREGRLAGLGAVGVRKAGTETAVTRDDEFHIGSCTKAMTATVLATLVDAGKLRWETMLPEALPDLAGAMHAGYRNVTLLHLLAHRAGLVANAPPGMPFARLHELLGTPTEQRQAFARALLAVPPQSAPGEKFLYSNAGYAVAALIAERVAKKSWREMMRERVFQPLGMASAGFGAMGAPGKIDQPWQHVLRDGKPVPIAPGPRSDNPPAYDPAGRVHCSMADWAKFVAAHLDGPRGRACGLRLKPETWRRLHTPPFGGDYALGWGTPQRSWGGGTVLTHAGSNTMNYAVVWVAPKRDFAVLVATNLGGGPAPKACDEAAWLLIQELLLKPAATTRPMEQAAGRPSPAEGNPCRT